MSKTDLKDLTNIEEYDNYQKRLATEKYKNEGNIDIELNMGEEMNFAEKFVYTSKVDQLNNRASSNVTINKDGNDVLSIDYLKNEDLYGVKFEQIVNQYIVIENKNLKEFAKKLGIEDTSNIPDKIDLSNSEYNEIVNEEELKQIYDKYINIIIEQIPEESYSKVENGYSLTIDLKTLQNILNKVMNTLKEDEQVFNIINSLVTATNSTQKLSFEQYKEALKEVVEEISVEMTEENHDIINIVAYKQGKIYAKIAENITDERTSYVEIIIEKNKENVVLNLNGGDEDGEIINFSISKNVNTTENEEYDIEAIIKNNGEEIANINIQKARKGILTSNNIENNLIVSAVIPEENGEVTLEYNSNIMFDPNIEVEEFNESNHAVINEFSTEEINNLITNLSNKILEKTGLNITEALGATAVGLISASQQNLRKNFINRRSGSHFSYFNSQYKF